MLNYTNITQNTYIQSWTVTEIMAIEKCGLLWCPRTVSRPWCHIHSLRMPGNEKPLANIGMQWRQDNPQLLPASITWKPKDKFDSSASVFVVQFNGFMSLTSYFDANPRGRNTLPFKGEKASTWSITGGPHYFSCHWLFGPPTSEPRTLVGKELACTTVIVTDSKQTH